MRARGASALKELDLQALQGRVFGFHSKDPFIMCRILLQNPNFFKFLLHIDREHAAEVRFRRCSHCGGPLHQAHYHNSNAWSFVNSITFRTESVRALAESKKCWDMANLTITSNYVLIIHILLCNSSNVANILICLTHYLICVLN